MTSTGSVSTTVMVGGVSETSASFFIFVFLFLFLLPHEENRVTESSQSAGCSSHWKTTSRRPRCHCAGGGGAIGVCIVCVRVCGCVCVFSRHRGLETSSRRRGRTGAGRVPLRWRPLQTGWAAAWRGNHCSQFLSVLLFHCDSSCTNITIDCC